MGGLDFLHGGNIYAVKEESEKEIIDFSASINPLGVPAGVRKAVYMNFDKILHYPDPEARKVRRAIAGYWEIDEDNILIGNGSVELIYLIISAFRPRAVSILLPTFSEYERAARSVKSRIQFVGLDPEDGFSLRNKKIARTDILFLGNPNNPTGNIILDDYEEFDQFHSGLTVIDEAFMDFLPDEENHTLIWKAQKSKNILVLRTFTKFFALPGLRIGYLIAHKDVIQRMKRHQIPWSVNAFAQEAARVLLSDKTYINKTKLFIEKERKFLFDGVADINGLAPYPSVTNYLLIRIESKKLNSSLLAKRLIRRGILIRDCANFRGLDKRFIRIAVRLRRENLALLRALRGAL